ncbi:MAG: alpha/beta fold hydrolase [Alphaproteobacteria bacterium]|nr:alpha/beta fold hydrolase [Alphaproteobacteria bacterium]
MIDHIGLKVADYARARAFYEAALQPLGVTVVMSVGTAETGGYEGCGFGRDGKPSFWIGTGTPASGPLHVAFVAADRPAVDAFHRAALAAGGRDNGAPGIRAHYHPNYYGAFVLDLDGNNVEAVCHRAATADQDCPMDLRYVSCLGGRGFHRMAYRVWPGPAGRPPVVCLHGLTRNGRDFDVLARALSAGRTVICPDVVGRGDSDRLGEPSEYGYPRYLADMATLLARLDVEQVDWVGTSMGGFAGLMLAATRGHPIRRLVLNDVGPFIPKAALEHIAGYVGQDPRFATLAEAEAYQRTVAAGFGRLTDAQWADMARNMTRPDGEGGFRLAYDPQIAHPFRAQPIRDVDVWPLYDRVAVPTLVLRGAQSGLLLAETAREMTERGPKARIVEVPDAAHAPALVDEAQIAVVASFLDE